MNVYSCMFYGLLFDGKRHILPVLPIAQKKTAAAMILMFCSLQWPYSPAAEDCPEIPPGLQTEMQAAHAGYEPASSAILSSRERKTLERQTGSRCLHVAAIADSVYALVLKNKLTGEFLLVLAALQPESAIDNWSLREVAVYSDDIPLISATRAGLYSDMLTRKNFTVTRSSQAVTATMLHSRRQYIYEKNDADEFDIFRIN